MNRLVTFTLMPLTVGITVVFFALGNIVHESLSGWLWWLVAPPALAVVLLVALLMNFGIFAPAYWVLGRRKPNNQQRHNERD